MRFAAAGTTPVETGHRTPEPQRSQGPDRRSGTGAGPGFRTGLPAGGIPPCSLFGTKTSDPGS